MRTALTNSRQVPSPNPLIPLFAQARVRTRNGKLRKSDRGKMLGLARGFHCFPSRYISAAVSPRKFTERGIVVRQSVRLLLSTASSSIITPSISPGNGNRAIKVRWRRGTLFCLTRELDLQAKSPGYLIARRKGNPENYLYSVGILFINVYASKESRECILAKSIIRTFHYWRS